MAKDDEWGGKQKEAKKPKEYEKKKEKRRKREIRDLMPGTVLRPRIMGG